MSSAFVTLKKRVHDPHEFCVQSLVSVQKLCSLNISCWPRVRVYSVPSVSAAASIRYWYLIVLSPMKTKCTPSGRHATTPRDGLQKQAPLGRHSVEAERLRKIAVPCAMGQ